MHALLQGLLTRDPAKRLGMGGSPAGVPLFFVYLSMETIEPSDPSADACSGEAPRDARLPAVPKSTDLYETPEC